MSRQSFSQPVSLKWRRMPSYNSYKDWGGVDQPVRPTSPRNAVSTGLWGNPTKQTIYINTPRNARRKSINYHKVWSI